MGTVIKSHFLVFGTLFILGPTLLELVLICWEIPQNPEQPVYVGPGDWLPNSQIFPIFPTLKNRACQAMRGASIYLYIEARLYICI